MRTSRSGRTGARIPAWTSSGSSSAWPTAAVAAPRSSTLGFGHTLLTLVRGGTLVLRRHFDPEAALAAACGHDCRVLVVVPVMLKRILDLPDAGQPGR